MSKIFIANLREQAPMIKQTYYRFLHTWSTVNATSLSFLNNFPKIAYTNNMIVNDAGSDTNIWPTHNRMIVNAKSGKTILNNRNRNKKKSSCNIIN